MIMDAIIINISGNWGHFKKVDTNNNPLTHDFITKTALIGLIGAVNGIERTELKNLFPELSEDIMYSVALNKHVKKESWGFTLRSVKVNTEKSPWQFEFLKSPDFTVVIVLKNDRSKKVFDDFALNIQNGSACYNPTLVLANCPADIAFVSLANVSEKKSGAFETNGFVSKNHQIDITKSFDFRIGFEKVPTYQDNDFWNDPEKYAEVAYCSPGSTFKVKMGDYYNISTNNEESQWYLI